MSGKRKAIEAGMSAIKKEAAVLAKAKKKAAALAEAEKKMERDFNTLYFGKDRKHWEATGGLATWAAALDKAKKKTAAAVKAEKKAAGAVKAEKKVAAAVKAKKKAADSQLGPVVPIKPGSADDILDKAWTKEVSTTPVTSKKVTGGTSKKGTSKKVAPLLTKKEKLGIGVAALATAGTGYKLYQLNTKSYSVKSGDTLSQLAKKNNITLKKLLEANPNIKDPNKIRVGQKIKIPFGMTKKPVYKGLSKKEMASMAMPKVKGGRGFEREKPGERAEAKSLQTEVNKAWETIKNMKTGGKVTNPARIKSTIRMASGGDVGSKLIDDIYNA
jgi:LysM repeat protein